MSFVIRSAKAEDLEGLYELSQQFVLLNLPSSRKKIAEKLEKSMASFSGQSSIEDSRYIFVCEDLDTNKIAGCSQIVGKKGTEENPNYSFKIIKKEKFSPDLSVGFIHQILRLNLDTDGPTEVGGLIVSKDYRTRPEKIGKMLSLCRFVYMGLHQESFMDQVLSEMAPPLKSDGRSEFWEALGRRFTGMPYQEADSLSNRNKDFIKSLFPEEDIYTCLLDSKARLVMGQVSQETQPALQMLSQIGFKNYNHIDPFDGGPHLIADTKEIKIIKDGKVCEISPDCDQFDGRSLLGHVKDGKFYGSIVASKVEGAKIYIPEREKQILNLKDLDKVFTYQL